MSQFWDRQKIIKKLQNLRDRNLPLYAHYMLKTTRHDFLAREGNLDRGTIRCALPA